MRHNGMKKLETKCTSVYSDMEHKEKSQHAGRERDVIEKTGLVMAIPGLRGWSCIYFSVRRWNVKCLQVPHTICFCCWQDRQSVCFRREIHSPLLFIPLGYMFSFYMGLINWSDKIAVLTRYKLRMHYTQVGSKWGNGGQDLVPLCYTCIYWLGYCLATVASRTTTGTVTQIRQTPCRH